MKRWGISNRSLGSCLILLFTMLVLCSSCAGLTAKRSHDSSSAPPASTHANEQDESLFKSVFAGDLEKAELALNAGANVNAVNEHGLTALMAASLGGHNKIAELLVSKGADINAKTGDGNTALLMALGNSHPESAKLLISKGADVNVTSKVLAGFTPLILASMRGYVEIVELLIAKGADLKVKDYNGKTAFMWAKSQGHTKAAKLLKEAGAKE